MSIFKKKKPTKIELQREIRYVEYEMKQEWKYGCHGGFQQLEKKLEQLKSQLQEAI